MEDWVRLCWKIFDTYKNKNKNYLEGKTLLCHFSCECKRKLEVEFKGVLQNIFIQKVVSAIILVNPIALNIWNVEELEYDEYDHYEDDDDDDIDGGDDNEYADDDDEYDDDNEDNHYDDDDEVKKRLIPTSPRPAPAWPNDSIYPTLLFTILIQYYIAIYTTLYNTKSGRSSTVIVVVVEVPVVVVVIVYYSMVQLGRESGVVVDNNDATSGQRPPAS